MKRIAPLFLLAALMLVGCGKATEPNTDGGHEGIVAIPGSNVAAPHLTDSDALIQEKGRAVVQEAFAMLSTNLLSALGAGGPSNAIPFCSVQALPLTESVSQKFAAEVRRVSQRTRNPRNAPSARETSMLEGFQSQLAAGESPRPAIIRTNNEVFYYAPIMINTPLCLICHGEPRRDMAAETTQLLRKLYPDDQATGYQLNDLRGMWVVKLPP